MVFAAKTNVNVGLIATTWNISPLFLALFDYFIFGQKLRYFHILGLVAIIFCCVMISFSVGEGEKIVNGSGGSSSNPMWLPIMFGLLTPVAVVLNGIFTKYLTGDELKFDPTRMAFFAFLMVNTVFLVTGVIYWNYSGTFRLHMFMLGLLGSTLNTLGLVCI
jgi:drug/metabolite transporter (DMT)-like permease